MLADLALDFTPCSINFNDGKNTSNLVVLCDTVALYTCSPFIQQACDDDDFALPQFVMVVVAPVFSLAPSRVNSDMFGCIVHICPTVSK